MQTLVLHLWCVFSAWDMMFSWSSVQELEVGQRLRLCFVGKKRLAFSLFSSQGPFSFMGDMNMSCCHAYR